MLLIIIFGLLIIGVLGLIVYDNDWFKYEWANWTMLIIGSIATIIAALGIIGSGIAFSVNYLGIEGKIEKYNKHYESLVFQVEHNLYKDDITENATRELVKEVQEWNCDLVKNKVNQYDSWIGIYIPDIYDQFEFIQLNGLLKGEENNDL